MISNTEGALLDAPLSCDRSGCKGIIPHVSLRMARALIEYFLRDDSTYRLHGVCSECGTKREFTYSDILNRIPAHLRPKPLPENHFWALMLIAGPQIASGESCFVGDRVLIECLQDDGEVWTGRLRSPSAFTPTLEVDTIISGRRVGNAIICTGFVGLSGVDKLPFAWPADGTADSAVFYTRPDAPNDLLGAQPCCSNPSCPHYFGIFHSQFRSALEARRNDDWFWGTESIIFGNCQGCGTSTVIDEDTYATLFHV